MKKLAIIGNEEIQKLNISYELGCQWMRELFCLKEQCNLPPKVSIKINDDGFFNTMPSVVTFQNGEKIFGTKIVTRNSSRTPAIDGEIFLYDYNSMNILAIMDAQFITEFRTGCVAAIAIEQLAVKNYSTIGMFGLGVIGTSVMNAIISQLNGREITVKILKYKNTHISFIEKFKKYKNINFELTETYEDTVKNSDVIISCITYADHDLVDSKYFKKGCLLVPVHTRGFQNCDLCFDKVFVDDFGHTKTFKYFNDFKYVDELSNIFSGKNKGRENDKERIISYNVGLSIEDVFVAKKIYNMIKGRIITL